MKIRYNVVLRDHHFLDIIRVEWFGLRRTIIDSVHDTTSDAYIHDRIREDLNEILTVVLDYPLESDLINNHKRRYILEVKATNTKFERS